MDIAVWLRNLGFGRYVPAFIENRIDSDVLPDLSELDLEKLGIPLGDRKRMMRAIRAQHPESSNALVTGNSQGSPLARAERRHLTVMICDLVGSTALSARLDPEDMCAVMDAFHAACARVVLSYDGFLAEFRGDGILAYFGYPRAHEDDAERTVRAGLDIIAAVAHLKTRAAEPLAVRIGVASGLVVVGDIGAEGALQQQGVVGDTPNVAARLQAVAKPGMMVVAASTRQLLRDRFRLRDLGQHEAKGFAEPLAAWAVEELSAIQSRFEAIRLSEQGLIGRETEIDFLRKRQRLAWKGEGQIVLVSGEPGIGKSRLAAALAERIADEPHTLVSYHCSPYHTNSALHPFITQLERAAGFKADDSPEQRIQKLETIIATGPSRVQVAAPLFAALLSIPFGERYAQLALGATQQRRRTFAAFLDQLEDLAHQQPVLLVFEDTHWADATSLELLDLIVERVRPLPVLALFTSRPEFEPPWIGLPHVSALPIGPLDPDDVQRVVSRVTGDRDLPAEVMQQIVAKTSGNPLFVEELTKAVLEGGILVTDGEGYRLDGALPPLAIPATLQDSLMARLDRLAPRTKEICQIGAAIGREFSYPLLREVVSRDETALTGALAELELAELVFRHGESTEAVYSFKHALVQAAAYESLLKIHRQQLHGQIGHALSERFKDTVASEPEIVARHFTEARLDDRAVEYWLRAGKLALSRSANAEAVKHLKQGIELVLCQTDPAKRIRQELDLYLALGPAMAATEGYATKETLSVFSHARELLGAGGTPTERMTVLWGAYLAHGMRAEHAAALEVAHQLAAHHEHPGMSALGNRFMGQTLNLMGDFPKARQHLERSLAICAANERAIIDSRRFGTDDQVAALSYLGSTLLLLGFPEQSSTSAAKAVSRARTLDLPLTTALSLSHVALLGIFGGDPHQAASYADEAIVHCIKHRLSDPEHWARFTQGALLAQGDDPQHGLEIMRKAIRAAEGNADFNRRTLYLGLVASAHAKLGDCDIGLKLLDEAIQLAGLNKEGFFEPELHRIRGNILVILNRREEAEVAFRRSLRIAQQQQARWWGLRAAICLARQWRDLGRPSEAYSLLHPLYTWFAEGFEMVALKSAKELLDELRANPQPPAMNEGLLASHANLHGGHEE